MFFGYENTVIWEVSVSIFWMFWVIGCLALVLNKNWSFVFLFPASVLSIVVCLAAFQKARYSSLDFQIMTYVGLTFSMILLIYINWPTIRKRNGFTRNSYIFGALFLLFLIFLFLTIDQKK